MNYDIMTPEDLVRWYRPETHMETLLLQVIETVLEEHEESNSDNISSLENTIQELEDTTDALEAEISDLKSDLDQQIKMNRELTQEIVNLESRVNVFLDVINGQNELIEELVQNGSGS